MKHGVTQDLRTRYTQKELAGGYLTETANSPRRLIMKQERELVDADPVRAISSLGWKEKEAMSQELPTEAISFSAHFGGEDVQEALKPHFFALKREWIGGIGIGDTISSA